MGKKELTPKMDMFCQEYIIDFNGTQAAIRAGYSKKTAGQIADENLKKPQIQERIKELLAPKKAKLGIDSEYVLRNIKKIGEDCIEKGKEGGALKAQELLGRWLRLFEDDEGRETNVVVHVLPPIKINGVPFVPDIGKPVDEQ